MKTTWLLIIVAAVPVLTTPTAVRGGACIAARFHDWQDMGCNQNITGAGTAPKSGCPSCNGMPRWWVSEPYINLCLVDTPLNYTMSSGKSMDFTFNYRQRTKLPDSDEVSTLPITDVYPGVSNCGTNAAWGNNWTESITVWDPTWESSWTTIGSTVYPPTYTVYSHGYLAFVWRPEGGIDYFNVPLGLQNTLNSQSLERITSVTSGQNYPVVWNQTGTYGSRVNNNVPTADANGIYWDTGIGVKLVHADGSQDVFGLNPYPVKAYSYPSTFGSPTGYSTARLLLTQRIDPQGRITQLGYEQETNTIPYAFRLRYVVDPDGRTNTFRYSSGLQLTEIDDPYGRNSKMKYDSSGRMTNIVDAVTNSSSFGYLGVNGWINKLTTPYGSNNFVYYELPDTSVTDGFQQRAIYVTEPEGAQQLYGYFHTTTAVSSTETSPTVPGQTNFDNGSSGTQHIGLNYRNTFHWGRRQFAALSGNYYLNEGLSEALTYQITNTSFSASEFASALAALGNSDFTKAGMKHWLMLAADDVSITESLSSERDPSPDSGGLTAGLRTWYNYSGKPTGEPELSGSSPQVGCTARLLPDGSSQYSVYHYNSITAIPGFPVGAGLVSSNEASFTKPDGSAGVLTNWFTYAANSVDLLSLTNSTGQYVNLANNSYHQVTQITNALSQVTTFSWDSYTHNLTGIQTPGGKSISLTYYSSATPPTSTSSLLDSISISPESRSFTINDFVASNPSDITDDRGLHVVNTWDGLNRLTGTSFPDSTTISNLYYRLDLVGSKDRLGNWTRYAYDGLQHLTSVTNANNAVTYYSWCGCGSLNEIIDAENGLTSPTFLYYDNQGNLTNVAFPDTSSLTWQFDLAGRMTNVFDGAGRWLQVAYNNQGLATNIVCANGTLQSVIYDAVNRPISVTDANGVTVTNSYDAINELLKRTWPDNIGESFGYNAAGLIAYTNRDSQRTIYGRDGAGRLTAVTNANQEVTLFGYNSLDEVTSLIDGLLHQTTWQYNEYGWLTNKLDGLSRTNFIYTYNANGWVINRWLPEKGNTGYAYDNVGSLKTITYPLSAISYSYDALNRLTNMVDASGTTAIGYTPAGQLKSEDGPWASDTLTNGYVQGLRTALGLTQASGSWSQSYGYDAGWRMNSVVSPAGTFGYSYGFQPASRLPTGISLPNGANIVNTYDSLARLKETDLNNQWGHTLDGAAYDLDTLGLRTNIVRNLGLTSSTVTAGFDNIGQLTSWNAKEAGGTLRQNEQLGFGFDAAHNLHTRTNGYLAQTFTTDAANELTGVTRTGTFTESGTTPVPTTSVTVNTLAAQTYGDFTFARTNFTLANGNNSFTNIAQNVYGLKSTNTVTVNLPTSVTLSPDANGSLTNDGARTFAYDAENQLTNITVANSWKSDFTYDGLNRRRIERDYSWSGSTWAPTNEIRYIYDGYLLVQERNSNNAVMVTYTRGIDMSGSVHGAGGIGGLLARTDGTGSAFYHADGSGNITALINGSQNFVARYLYNPFGKLEGKWGALADANTMQFSSMPQHDGLTFYPFRAYEPNLQRFLNQDPIQENGGINLYAFVGNSPLNRVDPLGLAFGDWWDPRSYSSGYAAVQGELAIQQQLNNAGYDSMADFQLDHPGYGGTQTAGDTGVVQATAAVASDAANAYLTAATSITPTAIGGRAACKLTQQGLEHIAERHLFTSGAQGAGKFAQDMGARTIRDLINDAVANGASSAGRFGRTVYDYDFGRVIGTDINGNPATSLRVVVAPNGSVVTAFPK